MLGAGGVREFAGDTNQVGKNRVDFGQPTFECGELGGSADGGGCVQFYRPTATPENATEAAAYMQWSSIFDNSCTNKWSVVPA